MPFSYQEGLPSIPPPFAKSLPPAPPLSTQLGWQWWCHVELAPQALFWVLVWYVGPEFGFRILGSGPGV